MSKAFHFERKWPVPKKVQIVWNGNPLPESDEDTLVVTDEPLCDADRVWFEDYFDYHGYSKDIFNAASSFAKNCCEREEFANIKICGASLIKLVEHYIYSFRLQVLRDRMLISNMLERESPLILSLSGKTVDDEKIAAAQFDQGLFEYTAEVIAKQRGIAIESRGIAEGKTMLGCKNGQLFLIGAADQLRNILRGRRLENGRVVLVSPQVICRLGSHFINRVRDYGFVPVSIGLDKEGDYETIYTLCGRKVTPMLRISDYRKIWEQFDSIRSEVWDNIFFYKGISYGDITKKVITNLLMKFMWGEGYRVRLLEKFLGLYEPAAMFVLYDRGVNESAAVQMAGQRGIKTITIQHGVNYQGFNYFISSSILACWGTKEKEEAIRCGVPEHKTRITGFPGFDGLWYDKIHIFRGPHGHLRVLVATQGAQSSVDLLYRREPTPRLINTLVGVLKTRPDLTITIRLHPNETLSHRAEIIANEAGIKITKGIPLVDQLKDIDVVVVHYSTIGIEALLLGKPLVLLNWFSEDEVIPYGTERVADTSYTPEDLPLTIERAVFDHPKKCERISTFLRNHLEGDGATERLLALISE